MSEGQAVLIVGASSAIAQALAYEVLVKERPSHLFLISRHFSEAYHDALDEFSRRLAGNAAELCWLTCDYSEQAIDRVFAQLETYRGQFKRVFVCNGQLHADAFAPEKRLEALQAEAMSAVFQINTIIPALWLRGLLPLVAGRLFCTVVLFSARVGSISDNRLGGWYSYRSSKAALNMLVKTAGIEYRRRGKNVKLIVFHPGTTDTPLSKPFQSNVPKDKLFTPDFVAQQLLGICLGCEPDGEVEFLDWAGEEIEW